MGLSNKGYCYAVVAVIEHPVQLGPFAGEPCHALDVDNTIAFVEANPDVDASTVVVMGHSFGGVGGVSVLYKLNEMGVATVMILAILELSQGGV